MNKSAKTWIGSFPGACNENPVLFLGARVPGSLSLSGAITTGKLLPFFFVGGLMRGIALAVVIMSLATTSWAWVNPYEKKRPYEDAWGNHYQYRQNLYKDSDRDGVSNMYDYNDTNRQVQSPFQNRFQYKYVPQSSHPIQFQQPNFYKNIFETE